MKLFLEGSRASWFEIGEHFGICFGFLENKALWFWRNNERKCSCSSKQQHLVRTLMVWGSEMRHIINFCFLKDFIFATWNSWSVEKRAICCQTIKWWWVDLHICFCFKSKTNKLYDFSLAVWNYSLHLFDWQCTMDQSWLGNRLKVLCFYEISGELSVIKYPCNQLIYNFRNARQQKFPIISESFHREFYELFDDILITMQTTAPKLQTLTNTDKINGWTQNSHKVAQLRMLWTLHFEFPTPFRPIKTQPNILITKIVGILSTKRVE